MIERTLGCDDVEAGDLSAQYASGQLPAASIASFEEHLLVCTPCQEMVRMAVAIRRADDGEQTPAVTRRARHRARPALVAVAAALLIVVAGGVALNRVRESRMRGLGALETPPVYQGLVVRSAPSESDGAFAGAMSDYAAGRYAAAASSLTRLISQGNGGEPALFFRGVSSLMLDHASSARDDFTRVLAAGATPYAAESHYYRALAEFRMGNAAAAEADLIAIPDGEPIAQQAHQLLATAEAQRSR